MGGQRHLETRHLEIQDHDGGQPGRVVTNRGSELLHRSQMVRNGVLIQAS